MILTVTLNAALDATYHVDGVEWGGVNRVDSVSGRAGGKGINVARVLVALGQEAVITGFAGGVTGDAIRREAVSAGMTDRLVHIAAESRRTLAVVEPTRATVFNEPGPSVSQHEWAAFVTAFGGLLDGCRAVVLSGSLPPGVPTDAYAVLIALARRSGVPVLLDAQGEALKAGLAAGPAIAKPNAHEVEAVTGVPCHELDEAMAAATWLRSSGADAAVVTRGADGMVASTPEGRWLALPPERVNGNEVGAGDASAAALALGLAEGRPWRDRLADAVAAGAAALRGRMAGDVDLEAYRRFRASVRLDGL